MRDFKTLNIWEEAHHLTLDVYWITSSFPAQERYGLTSQLRRASASIPANIAEGGGRDGDGVGKRIRISCDPGARFGLSI